MSDRQYMTEVLAVEVGQQQKQHEMGSEGSVALPGRLY